MKTIYINKQATRSTAIQKTNKSFLDYRIGFWANVYEVDSKINAVNVIADTGQKIIGLPVFSSEWVNKNDDYISGSRNLPPVGARVFVLMPTQTLAGAFVLCSGYSIGDTDLHELYAQNDNEKEEKNNSKEKITQGGWHITESYKDGNLLIESKDRKIKIELKIDGEEKAAKITAFENVFNFNDQVFSITDKNGNKIESSSTSIKINGNLEVLQNLEDLQ